MEHDYERPNTVSGLVAKHKELTDLRERYRNEIKKLTVDIDHLDACIRLFDPNKETSEIKEYVARRRAKRGSLQRFILSTLREATKPMTSRDLAELWIQKENLQPHEDTIVAIRKQLSMCIRNCANRGLVEGVEKTIERDVFGSSKLWQLRKATPAA